MLGAEMTEAAAFATFWAQPADQLLAELGLRTNGLSDEEARERIARYGLNSIQADAALDWAKLLLRQFASPLVLILIVGGAISLFLREWIEAAIILAIVTGGALLGFVQEYRIDWDARPPWVEKQLLNGRIERLSQFRVPKA